VSEIAGVGRNLPMKLDADTSVGSVPETAGVGSNLPMKLGADTSVGSVPEMAGVDRKSTHEARRGHFGRISVRNGRRG
jgi:hypothetical protein